MSRSPRTLTRRALVAGGVAGTAAALTGCDLVGDLVGDSEEPAVSGAVTPTAPAVDADSALVAEVVRAVAATSALAAATGTAVPALARTGSHLARLHDAHVARLGGAGASDPAEPADPPAVPAGRAAALRRLLQAEERLQDQLVTAAGSAQSGGLAQVLAAMAAAVAQQRAELR